MIQKSTAGGKTIVISPWLQRVTTSATPDELPILASTRQHLEPLLTDGLAPLRTLALPLMSDPALALRVLQQANAVPHRYFRADVVTLDDAVHMLGTQTLLRLESEARVDEQVLDGERLLSYRRSSGRAVLAALLAYDWAALDRDRFPSEVSLAALLNNLGELFLLARGDARIYRYLALVEHRHVLPHEAEYVSLSESLDEMGHALAVEWRLPEMVREAMRARNAQYLRTLCVMLATQTARYAFSGWKHPMQSSNLRLAAAMLELDMPVLLERINRVLSNFNQRADYYGLKPLPCLPLEDAGRAVLGRDPPWNTPFCLAPRADDFATAMDALREGHAHDRDAVYAILLRGLHRGLGLNRVVFAAYDARQERLSAAHLVGTDFEPAFNRFGLSCTEGGLFGELLRRPMSIWANDRNQAELLPRFPDRIRALTGVTRFFVTSVWVKKRPIGIVYADRRSANCALDARSYASFQALIAQAADCLERLTP